jgi:hypothetical protein
LDGSDLLKRLFIRRYGSAEANGEVSPGDMSNQCDESILCRTIVDIARRSSRAYNTNDLNNAQEVEEAIDMKVRVTHIRPEKVRYLNVF